MKVDLFLNWLPTSFALGCICCSRCFRFAVFTNLLKLAGLAVTAVAIPLSSLSGCGKYADEGNDFENVAASPSISPSAPASNNVPRVRSTVTLESDQLERFEYDAGTAVAGEPVLHSFTFVNRTNGEVTVRHDDDIKNNCGCTTLSLTIRRLLPGESTKVDVSVDTTAEVGPLERGGSVVWTTADNRRYVTRYVIKCNVIAALEFEPQSLAFSDDDVANGVVKAIRVRSALSVDWGSVSAVSFSESFQVVECSSDIAGGYGVCRVKCSAPLDLKTQQGLAIISALWQPPNGKSSKQVSALLPLLFDKSLTLEYYPRIATVRIDGDGTGTTKLLLNGSNLRTDSIDCVAAEGFEVCWAWSQSKANLGFLVIRMRLKPSTNALAPGRGELIISCGQRKPLIVPFMMVGPTDAPRASAGG